jgi:hypothetical protein
MTDKTVDIPIRMVKMETDIEVLKEGQNKLNKLIIGNGNRGLAEIVRDICKINESVTKRLDNIEKEREEDQRKKIETMKEREKERRKTVNDIIFGVLGSLILIIILNIIRNPEILKLIFSK